MSDSGAAFIEFNENVGLLEGGRPELDSVPGLYFVQSRNSIFAEV